MENYRPDMELGKFLYAGVCPQEYIRGDLGRTSYHKTSLDGCASLLSSSRKQDKERKTIFSKTFATCSSLISVQEPAHKIEGRLISQFENFLTLF